MRKPDCYLVRLGEQALKSRQVQRLWMKILLNNIKSGFKKKVKIEIDQNRIFIFTDDKKIEDILERTFGITSFSPVWMCSSDMKEIKKLANEIGKNIMKIKKEESFAVRARRAGIHDFTSQDVGREAGSAVWKVAKSKIDLTKPDKKLFIEVRQTRAYMYLEKINGPGGVPIGTGGKVVVLMSGGIDSPVAAWMMMKRGCDVILLYADNTPYSDKTNLNKVKNVSKILDKWYVGRKLKIYSFSNGKILKEFIKKCNIDMTCLLCKRVMYRAAEGLAKKENALAIVTGEALAQVASQTLMNIKVLDEASDMPILRPLICMDKSEIIKTAECIGTYNASIMKAKECEAVPEHPITKGKIRDIKREEKKIELNKLINKSLKGIKQLKN